MANSSIDRQYKVQLVVALRQGIEFNSPSTPARRIPPKLAATMVADYTEEEVKKAHEVLYSEGIKMRYKVAGKKYVDGALNAASKDYGRHMQEVWEP